MPGEANLWGDLDPIAVTATAPVENLAAEQGPVLSEGNLTDVITGDKQVKDTPKEQVRQFIAQALHEQYSIAYEDMEADFPLKLEGKNRAVKIDIAVFHHGQPHDARQLSRAVVCKPEPQPGKGSVKLRDHKEASKDLEELETIMRAVPTCEYGLWTNGLELFYFTKEVGRFDITMVELAAWPQAGESVKEAGGRMTTIPPKTVGKDVLKIAFRRCHNYIHGNEGMSKDTAFLQFLYVIFCKMYDEEQPSEERKFQIGLTEPLNETTYGAISGRVRQLFQVVKQLNPDIFRKNDEITLSDRALAFIVSELARYDLSNSDIDAKGLAYQEIVGANMRGDRGQYFTPQGVVNLAAEILMPGAEERVFDPACGTGGFLRETLKYRFRAFCEELGITPEQKKTAEYVQARSKLSGYAERYVYGADFDPALVRASRMQMVMFGDGHGHLYHMNSLEFPRGDLSGVRGAREEIPLGSIDVLLTNPPFGSDIPITEPTILREYHLANGWQADDESGFREGLNQKAQMPPEVLFIERCLQWLRPGGRMGIVLPDGILGNPGDEYIRYWIMKNAWVLASIDLPIECFIVEANVNILTSLLVLKKKSDEERRFEALNGPVEYPVFMAVAEKVGYDRRGNKLYKRNPDGEVKLFPGTPTTRQRIKDGRAYEVTHTPLTPELDDDLPLIIEKYREFRDRHGEPGL